MIFNVEAKLFLMLNIILHVTVSFIALFSELHPLSTLQISGTDYSCLSLLVWYTRVWVRHRKCEDEQLHSLLGHRPDPDSTLVSFRITLLLLHECSAHPSIQRLSFCYKSWILSGPFHQTPLLTTQVQTRGEDIEAFSLTLFLMIIDFQHHVTQMEAVILMCSIQQ